MDIRDINKIPKQKENKCKVTIRRSSDGKTISKEISDGCTREQLRTIREVDEKIED